jgi:hypothetical protein
MAGNKLRHSGNTEDLYSRTRITAEGRSAFERFIDRVRPYIIATTIMGATMAGPQRQAAAQEPRTQVDTRAVEQTRTQLVTDITAIRQTLANMTRQGMTPSAVSHTDAGVRDLISRLTALSTQLGADLIPISGSNDQEKFASLNRWLNSSWRGRQGLSGRSEISGLDSAALDELQLRLEIALGRASADSASAALLGLPVPAQPAVARGQTGQQGGPLTAVPARTDESALLLDLEVISEYGRNPTVRNQAAGLKRQIEAQTTAARPNATTLARLRRDAERLRTAEYDRSLERMNEQRAAEFERVTGGPHPLAGDISSLMQSGSADVRRMLPNVWLLGDSQMRRMFNLLREGNVTAATELFNAEQALYAQILERYIVPTATASVREVHDSSLPTRADLRSTETSRRLRAGTLHNIPIREGGSPTGRQLRRVTPGREDLEAVMQGRLDTATRLQGQRGTISFNVLSDLMRSVQVDERMLHAIVGLWNYARSSGLDANAEASGIWSNYAATATMFVDPQANPFALYSSEQRTRLIRLHLGIPEDRPLTAPQISQATRELSAALMQSEQLKYEYTMYNFFDLVRRMREVNPALAPLAGVRSARATYEYEYLAYRLGFNPEFMDPAAWTAMSAPQRAQRRYEVARGFLDHAVSTSISSGMADDNPATRDRNEADPLIQDARAWLAAPAPTDAAALVRRADILYDMALSLTSIREAELWAGNESFRQSGISRDTLQRARDEIEHARWAFRANFRNSQIDPSYHENYSRVAADRATRMLAPRALQFTEPVGLFSTVNSGFLNPGQPSPIGEGLTITGDPTMADRRRGAAEAEQRYLTMIVHERGSSSFSPSSAENVLGTDGALGAFRTLDFRVGRLMPAGDVGGYPLLRPVNSRRNFTITPVDQHTSEGVAHEDLGHLSHGALYMELHKQFFMDGNRQTPDLLRGLNVAPDSVPVRRGTVFQDQDTALRTRFQAIARDLGAPTTAPLLASIRDRMISASSSYGTGTMADRQRDANRTMVAVLDARIAQLEVLLYGRTNPPENAPLNGYITHSDGQPVRISDLARSRDPRAYYVTRARESLERARTLRTGFDLGTDLMSGRINPREAIAIAETGIDSLTLEHAGQIERPRTPAITGTFYVPDNGIEITRIDGDPVRFRTRVTRIEVEEGGRRQSLEDFQRSHGEQNLSLYWFQYQTLGRRDSGGEEIRYLLNPRYSEEPERRYIGQIVRDVVLSDGTRMGDCVVRVERTRLDPSTGPEWAPRLVNGRVRREDVLFRIEQGSDGRPVINDLLRSNLADVARERTSRVDFVDRLSPTSHVIVHTSGQVQR